MRYRLILIFFTLCHTFFLPAQELSTNSLLFRGKVASSYPYVKYSGIYYAYDTKYLEGILKYNHKLYEGVFLNYNAHMDEMCVDNGNGIQPIVLNSGYFEYCLFGDMKFVYLKGVEEVEDGYYQVLFENDEAVLYKRIVKVFEDRAENKSFSPKVSYHFFRNGLYKRLRNKHQLLKLYPEHKKLRYKEQGSVDGDMVVILSKIYQMEGAR